MKKILYIMFACVLSVACSTKIEPQTSNTIEIPIDCTDEVFVVEKNDTNDSIAKLIDKVIDIKCLFDDVYDKYDITYYGDYEYKDSFRNVDKYKEMKWYAINHCLTDEHLNENILWDYNAGRRFLNDVLYDNYHLLLKSALNIDEISVDTKLEIEEKYSDFVERNINQKGNYELESMLSC